MGFIAVDYGSTSTYHWPLIGNFKFSSIVDEVGEALDKNFDVNGPFGFGEATKLLADTVRRTSYL